MGNIIQLVGRNSEEAGGEEDRISNLPNGVIGHILSHLPLEAAVRTSVLSKAWKYNWTWTRKVQIHIDPITLMFRTEHTDAGFVKFVDSVLTLSKNATDFSLRIEKHYDLLTHWISKVFDRNPSNIRTLKFIFSRSGPILLPSQSLLNCTKLENLELCHWDHDIILNFPVTVRKRTCFSNLITLKLRGIKIVNTNSSSDALLLEFPVLKSCTLFACAWMNVKVVEIHAPSMTTFSSWTPFNHSGIDKYTTKISGSSLTSFESHGGLPEHYFIQTRSTLVSAAIHNYNRANMDESLVAKSGTKTRSLINGFSNMEELKLSDCMAKAIAQSTSKHALPQYEKLKRLVIHGFYLFPFEWSSDALFELLHAAPSLKFLGIYEIDWDGYDLDYSVQSIPNCIVNQLEEVEFKYRAYKDTDQFKLEKFLLKNGLRLEKVSIYVCDGMKKGEILNRLSAFSRGSTCLTILAPEE